VRGKEGQCLFISLLYALINRKIFILIIIFLIKKCGLLKNNCLIIFGEYIFFIFNCLIFNKYMLKKKRKRSKETIKKR